MCDEQAKELTVWGRQHLGGPSTSSLQEEHKMKDNGIFSNCCEYQIENGTVKELSTLKYCFLYKLRVSLQPAEWMDALK